MNRNYIVLAGGAIALLVGMASALGSSGNASNSALAIQSSAMLPPHSSPPEPHVPVPNIPPPSMAIASSSPSAPITSSLPTVAITTCNGIPASANFRSIPSTAPGAVVAILPPGSTVALTGNIVNGDGVRWYQVQSGSQVGWVAACFVE